MMITALGNLVPPVAAFITAPILAHALGVVGRGEVTAAQAPLLLFIAVFTLGLPEAATYLLARYPTRITAVVGRAGVPLLVVGLLATVAATWLAGVLAAGDPTVTSLIQISALAIAPSLLLALLRAAAIGLQAWGLVALERAVSSVGRLVVLLLLLATDRLTVLAAVQVNAWYLIVGGLVYLYLFTSRARRASSSVDDSEGASDAITVPAMLRYGGGVWFGSLAGVLLARVDQLLMIPLSDSYQLGLYAVAVVVAEIPLLINNTVREVMFSADARSRDDAKLGYAARISGFICLVAAGGIAATMWWWLPILFGADFAPALPVAYVLLAAVVVGPPGSVAGAGLAARGLPQLRSVALLFALIVNVVLVLALVPSLGAMGAALATLAGNVVSSNANIVFMSRRFGIPFASFYRISRRDLSDFGRTVRRLLRRG